MATNRRLIETGSRIREEKLTPWGNHHVGWFVVLMVSLWVNVALLFALEVATGYIH